MRILLLLVAFASLSPAQTHYNMGPAHRFTPPPQPEAHVIRFSNGYVIDTRAGEPGIAEEWRVDEERSGELYWVVHFRDAEVRAGKRALVQSGIESFGYLPQGAALALMSAEMRDLASALPEVDWVGPYQPAYKVRAGLADAEGGIDLTVVMMPGRTADAVLALARAIGCLVEAVQVSRVATCVMMSADARDIPRIAGLDEVMWIQETVEPTLANDNCQWVVQTGWRSVAPPPTDTLARWVWTRGVRGQGLIMSTTDTGLNMAHDMFRDPALPVTPPGIWPGHRKVVAFKLYGGADGLEGQYHGSHVNGTLAGNDQATGGSSWYDGMAPDGRIYFVDVSSGGSFVLLPDLTTLWDTVYLGRGLPDSVRPIVQHSGSWGYGYGGDYVLQDATTDAFCWEHPDFLQLFCAGNEGAGRLRSPGAAKNVITVGATENGTGCNQLCDFSSRGPTLDGRIKPTLLAPGRWLYSAQSSGRSGYSQGYGTSMSTPAASGAVGLMRCYLNEGYYPTGEPVQANRLEYISAALLRSMAVVASDPNVTGYTVPSFDIGWGRIDVNSALYFPGGTSRLVLQDDTVGLGDGEYKEAWFEVASPGPLRACLAWTDTAAAVNASPTIVNVLNLELTAPDGTVYHGNQYANGQSIPNPGIWDLLNTEECCRINSPQPGLWRLRVYGPQVVTARPQQFAWSVTGNVTEVTGVREEDGGGMVGAEFRVPTLVHGVLVLPGDEPAVLLDVAGRKVTGLAPGRNDVSGLPQGVYYVTREGRVIARTLVAR